MQFTYCKFQVVDCRLEIVICTYILIWIWMWNLIWNWIWNWIWNSMWYVVYHVEERLPHSNDHEEWLDFADCCLLFLDYILQFTYLRFQVVDCRLEIAICTCILIWIWMWNPIWNWIWNWIWNSMWNCVDNAEEGLPHSNDQEEWLDINPLL